MNDLLVTFPARINHNPFKNATQNFYKILKLVFLNETAEGGEFEEFIDEDAKDRHWLFLTRANGSLEIYSLPDCLLRFGDRNFANAPRILETSRFEGSEGRRVDVLDVQEMNVFNMGPSSLPYIGHGLAGI